MDRPLDPQIQRRRTLRRAMTIGVGVAVVVWLLANVPGWVRPGIDRERIRTAVVMRGPLEATLTASGTVVPEKEQVLSSPVDTRLLEVLRVPGSTVKKRDPIGDVSATRQSLVDLEAQRDIAKLQVESNELALDRNQALFDKGIVAENDLRSAHTISSAQGSSGGVSRNLS